MRDDRRLRLLWFAGWAAVVLAGALAIVRIDIAQRREVFQTDARIAHRLLSQRAVQHDAILATLTLLGPGLDRAHRPEQHLSAAQPQVLAVWRLDPGQAWADPALQRAQVSSQATRRPELAVVDVRSGQFTLVASGEPFSFALLIDVQRMVPWEEWPIERAGAVSVVLAHEGQQMVIQTGLAVDAQPAGWTEGFVFSKGLATSSQPFELQLRRATGPAEWPWWRLSAWALLAVVSASGAYAWQRHLRGSRQGRHADEGLEIDFTTGAGAYTAAPRMVEGSFDLAYGDVNSLIEVTARQGEAAPVGVFMMFNASPSTIAVRADGPIRTPRDLEGRTIVGHASDVALHTFGAFCSSTSVDRSRVRVQTSFASMRSMADDVLQSGDVHGMFGYVSTIAGATASAGPAPLAKLRFLKYAEFVPDLYGSVLMASRRLLRDEPDTVARVVRAFNRGLADMLREPQAGIAAVARQASGIDRAAELLRWQTTLDVEMGHADGRTRGIGDVDEARLKRAIALIARSNELPRVPALQDVFVRDHLPPPGERVKIGAARPA